MNKGSIYKLYNEHGTYYGSTITSLKKRFKIHHYDSNDKNKNHSSKILFQNNCIPKIELIEDVEFNNIQELRDREAYYIRNLECVNKVIPDRTRQEYIKQYNLINKEKIAHKNNEYREKNKKHISQIKKNWYKNNKEQLLKQRKQYYINNKEKFVCKEKITCECGSTIIKANISRHKKTKKHLINIQKLNSNIII